MENNGGYNMKKKLILPILAISLAAYAPVTNAYASYSNNDLILSTANNTASNTLSDDDLIEMIEDTIPSDSDTIKHNIHLDDMGNYYLDISADEIKKDNVVIANLNRDLKTQYSNVISAYSALSENGHNLLEATGKGDKMFIVRAFDDLYDSSSDLIFCCIDGSTIYNCSD
jgi:hypothetical protein